MGEFINITKLPLLATPYSIALSASTNELWSLVLWFLAIINFHLFREKERAFMGDSSSSLY